MAFITSGRLAVKTATGPRILIEEVVEFRLFQGHAPPYISYGMCPVLRQLAGAVELQQFAQGGYTPGKALSGVRIRYIAAARELLYRHAVRLYVRVLAEHLGHALEGTVALEPYAVRAVDKGISGDAGSGLISLAEAAVDDEELAAALTGLSPFFALTGVWPFIMWPVSGSRPNSASIMRAVPSSSQ